MTNEYGLVQRVRRQVPSVQAGRPPRVLCGVSGGADSTALMVILADLARLDLLHLSICHVDHGVRDDSGRDAEAVQEIAERLEIVCHQRRVSAEALSAHRGVGGEEAMRRERYRAFANVLVEHECDVLALGHHIRDQEETVLLHLLRGAGLQGVAGMRAVSTLAVPWWGECAQAREIVAWRPLIDEDPTDLRELVVARGLPILEDPSNADLAFRRNGLRLEVIPAIERVFPGSAAAVARFARVAREDDELLVEHARDWLRAHSAGNRLDRSAVRDAHPALRRRGVRSWILGCERSLELPSERVDGVIDAALGSSSGQLIEVGAGCAVRVQRDVLMLRTSDSG